MTSVRASEEFAILLASRIVERYPFIEGLRERVRAERIRVLLNSENLRREDRPAVGATELCHPANKVTSMASFTAIFNKACGEIGSGTAPPGPDHRNSRIGHFVSNVPDTRGELEDYCFPVRKNLTRSHRQSTNPRLLQIRKIA